MKKFYTTLFFLLFICRVFAGTVGVNSSEYLLFAVPAGLLFLILGGSWLVNYLKKRIREYRELCEKLEEQPDESSEISSNFSPTGYFVP